MLAKIFSPRGKNHQRYVNSYIVTSVFNFSKIRTIPLELIGIIALIIAIGLVALNSADSSKVLLTRQIISIPFCIIAFLLIVSIHPSFIKRYAYQVYFLGLILLVLTCVIGNISLGARRWLNIFGLKIQPSEFMKIVVILALAKHFSNSSMRQISSILNTLRPILLGVTPIVLTIIQPDLGTGCIIAMIFVIIMFIAGIEIWKFVLCGVIILSSSPIIWSKLHDYQKQRIITFISPEADKLSSGYNIIQAKITIGSGGIIGNGIGMGNQTKSHFVPESETDFIFTVIAEEMGFIGCITLLMLYSGLFIYSYHIASITKDFFLKTTSYACICLLFVHIAMNTGMATGMLPAVGIPLPLVSYGRSSMLVSTIILGLIVNAFVNRDTNIR